MIPLSTMCPIADGSLKDHERDLFYAFLSLLADDAEPQDLVALVFWRKPTGQSSVLAATGLSAPEPSTAVGIFGDEVLRWVLRHNRPLVLDNGVGVLGRLQEVLDRAGLRSAAIFPLTHRGDPAGALVLGRRTGPSPFVFVDLALVTLFGHLLSATFERLGLFEWMQANAAGRQADPCREAGSARTDQMSREAASPPRRAGRFHPPSSPSAAAHHCRSITETEFPDVRATAR